MAPDLDIRRPTDRRLVGGRRGGGWRRGRNRGTARLPGPAGWETAPPCPCWVRRCTVVFSDEQWGAMSSRDMQRPTAR
eukprot:350904-Chlamydomonas_euryale.AAC.4